MPTQSLAHWIGGQEVPPQGEEVFDDLNPIESLQEGIDRANDSVYGLSAAIFTSNLDAAMRFAREINAGMVHVNGSTVQEEAHVPFGGVGDSGFGRESTDTDLADLTEWKWITLQSVL